MGAKLDFGLKGKNRDSYLGLVSAFPLATIQSDAHLAEAQKVMDRLLAQGKHDDGEAMYLDALSELVAAYEETHHAIEPASDADMLRHLMEAKGVTQAQLSRDAKLPKSTISEVLSGKKPFSRQMIRKLADYLRLLAPAHPAGRSGRGLTAETAETDAEGTKGRGTRKREFRFSVLCPPGPAVVSDSPRFSSLRSLRSLR
jgi:HTH-type transcriptional regulator/antitoxin HigA